MKLETKGNKGKSSETGQIRVIHKSMTIAFYSIPEVKHKAFPYPSVKGPEDKSTWDARVKTLPQQPLGMQVSSYSTASERQTSKLYVGEVLIAIQVKTHDIISCLLSPSCLSYSGEGLKQGVYLWMSYICVSSAAYCSVVYTCTAIHPSVTSQSSAWLELWVYTEHTIQIHTEQILSQINLS